MANHLTDAGETSLGNVQNAFENLAVCLAFYESAKTGRTVEVQYPV